MTKHNQHSDQHEEVTLTRKVSRMGMLIHRYYDAQAHRHGGMGDPLRGQGRVLALLAAKPTTTQRELSYLLDMRQQSLSELLAKLEEKGLVTREKSAQDGRVTVVTLTEQGAAAVPSPDQMHEQADALDCLSDDEREQLDTLTSKVVASLEEKLQAMGIDPAQPPRPRDGRGPHRHEGHGHHGPHDDRRPRGDHGTRGDRNQHDNRGPRGPYRPGGSYDDHRMRQA